MDHCVWPGPTQPSLASLLSLLRTSSLGASHGLSLSLRTIPGPDHRRQVEELLKYQGQGRVAKPDREGIDERGQKVVWFKLMVSGQVVDREFSIYERLSSRSVSDLVYEYQSKAKKEYLVRCSRGEMIVWGERGRGEGWGRGVARPSCVCVFCTCLPRVWAPSPTPSHSRAHAGVALRSAVRLASGACRHQHRRAGRLLPRPDTGGGEACRAAIPRPSLHVRRGNSGEREVRGIRDARSRVAGSSSTPAPPLPHTGRRPNRCKSQSEEPPFPHSQEAERGVCDAKGGLLPSPSPAERAPSQPQVLACTPD